MGRSAYWKGNLDSFPSCPLGDANRGAFLALQSAVSTRRRLVATDPPERRASSCSKAVLGACRYPGSRFGFASPARISSGLLRGGGTRRGDGGTSPFAVWASRLRAEADRSQRARRPCAREPRRGFRRGRARRTARSDARPL